MTESAAAKAAAAAAIMSGSGNGEGEDPALALPWESERIGPVLLAREPVEREARLSLRAGSSSSKGGGVGIALEPLSAERRAR